MTNLQTLKQALRQKASSCSQQRLSEEQYNTGFNALMQGAGWTSYEDFIVPQLSGLLTFLFNSRLCISILEIGPGPQSVLQHLPEDQRHKIRKYVAFEPNKLFAARLEEQLRITPHTDRPFPNLDGEPDIRPIPFGVNDNAKTITHENASDEYGEFDVVLFCHSMYGMKPKDRFIKAALKLLVKEPKNSMVVIFHRDNTLQLNGLVCHRTASLPTGTVRVPNNDEALDRFAAFIAGFDSPGVKIEWRKVCRALANVEEASTNDLLFSSPEVMIAFTRPAAALPELELQTPVDIEEKTLKNPIARLRRPAAVVRPTNVDEVQKCVRWALRHGLGLTVVSGGHGAHCVQNHVVAVDMSAFDEVHIIKSEKNKDLFSTDGGSFVVAGTGCKTSHIVHKAMAEGLAVPLGSRPSVGAGLWLQGGIGHLSRLHGLTCDAIVGAVLVRVDSGDALYVGHVPIQHRPAGSVCSEDESDLLWAIKGAGTNFCIVMSVVFRASTAPTYLTRNWILSPDNSCETEQKMRGIDKVTQDLQMNCSVDLYLYMDAGQRRLGAASFEVLDNPQIDTPTPGAASLRTTFGVEDNSDVVDGVAAFSKEMYMSGLHGGHGGGKTDSFKRCVFLKEIGAPDVAQVLVAAVESSPSPLCYLHLLHGGGTANKAAAQATPFGCRDWNFACVITGTWSREQDAIEAARSAAEKWVYQVVIDLLPFSNGVYSADLGPDPRDTALAAKAFGPNQPRLARLKQKFDPRNVLRYACPLSKTPFGPTIIVLATGKSCAGKDYCADVWATTLKARTDLSVRVVSISDATKREYAAATGADIHRLLTDRPYKEQHREKLTAFFCEQVAQRPKLPEEHFQSVVDGAADVDVLLITGMRDEAPVAKFSHLVPGSKVLEVRIVACEATLSGRRGDSVVSDNGEVQDNTGETTLGGIKHTPCLIFDNDTVGSKEAEQFAETYILPYIHEDLVRLAKMIRKVPGFPDPPIEFHHVLDIAQKKGGLDLCTSLLRACFIGDWSKVDAIACCETGGFLFAAALGMRVDKPLALIRAAGKLPPPTISSVKTSSHISSLVSRDSEEKQVEMDRDAVRKGASVVIVDDVLASGETICAVLELLNKAGVRNEDVTVMVVAEFPAHRGRLLLLERGFGKVKIQSLLVFGGT